MADKLFSDLELKNNPSMNGFDLSQRVDFTAKAGELLPVFHRTCMWKDAFKFQVDHFTRARTMVTASRTKINEFFDWFFVPYRLLYKNSNQVLTNNTKNSISATSNTSNLEVGTLMPCFDWRSFFQYFIGSPVGSTKGLSTRVNEHGYSRTALAMKLLNHLGFPYCTTEDIKALEIGDFGPCIRKWQKSPSTLSILPLLAYQCIYYNFYRNTQWEDNVPYNYNMDYAGASPVWSVPMNTNGQNEAFYSNPTLFDLRYSNYPRDLFFGILPDSQFGDESVVDVDSGVEGDVSGYVTDSSGAALQITSSGIQKEGGGTPTYGPIDVVLPESVLDIKGKFGILELRKAQFIQRAREIRGSGRQDYKSLVYRTFGFTVSDKDAQLPIYLGGKSFGINVQEVDNTNLADGNHVTIGGKATSAGASEIFELHPDEPGVLMCIYHCQPVIDYSLTALHFDLTKVQYDDWPNPLYDRLGFQELPTHFLTTQVDSDNVGINSSFIGWTSRYFDAKTGIDQTLGDLRETDVNWIAPLDFDYLFEFLDDDNNLQLNANFFKVRPSILDPIFAFDVSPDKNENASYVVTDQFSVFCHFNVNAVRPFDYRGVPY